MKILVKFSPEIFIKSCSVRIFFIKMLIKNIRIVLKKRNKFVSILRFWDHVQIHCKYNDYVSVSSILVDIPGIYCILIVQDSVIYSLEDIYHKIILTNCLHRLSGKKFCIRIKRYGNHVFNSQEIACYLGNKLCNNLDDVRVDLTKPDEILYLEIKNNHLFIVMQRYLGLGGLPIGTQQDSLSLISGGFDSAVSSYMLMRRGCRVHYCFFNLIGNNMDVYPSIEVYKIVYYLWNKFDCSHKVKFISIDFSEVVQNISSKIKNNYVGIILKRMMFRAAVLIAANLKIKALVTGEVLGQVSSQTLENLTLINNVIPENYIVLRPLIVHDKESIIELSRKIGTECFSRTVPEYCGVVSKKSTAKANKKYIELAENCLDTVILNKAVSQAHILDINDIPIFTMNKQHFCSIETTAQLSSEDIILDIRAPNEQDKNYPIQIPKNIKVQKIPFYKLSDQFPKLDQNKIYLLYCKHGIMSKLQAIHLYQKGFRNIKIYRFSVD